jgi:hypothetical protein
MGQTAHVRFRGIASALDGQWQTVVWDEKRQRSAPQNPPAISGTASYRELAHLSEALTAVTAAGLAT